MRNFFAKLVTLKVTIALKQIEVKMTTKKILGIVLAVLFGGAFATAFKLFSDFDDYEWDIQKI